MSSTSCDQLPSPLPWEMFGGDWNRYKEALYSIFKRDFLDNPPSFLGKPVDIIHQQFFEDKERSFWHIITAGNYDEQRTPDQERCAGISWVKPLIEETNVCEHYSLWVKWHDQTKRDRYYIWCQLVDYLVILEDRATHFKLITAYPVHLYSRAKLQKEYTKYLKTKTPT